MGFTFKDKSRFYSEIWLEDKYIGNISVFIGYTIKLEYTHHNPVTNQEDFFNFTLSSFNDLNSAKDYLRQSWVSAFYRRWVDSMISINK